MRQKHSLKIPKSLPNQQKVMDKPPGKWTNKQLIVELSKIGARTDGRKAQLVQRLEDYRRNSNFSGPVVQAPENDDMP